MGEKGMNWVIKEAVRQIGTNAQEIFRRDFVSRCHGMQLKICETKKLIFIGTDAFWSCHQVFYTCFVSQIFYFSNARVLASRLYVRAHKFSQFCCLLIYHSAIISLKIISVIRVRVFIKSTRGKCPPQRFLASCESFWVLSEICHFELII